MKPVSSIPCNPFDGSIRPLLPSKDMKVYSRIVVLVLLAAMVVDVLTITSTNKSDAGIA